GAGTLCNENQDHFEEDNEHELVEQDEHPELEGMNDEDMTNLSDHRTTSFNCESSLRGSRTVAGDDDGEGNESGFREMETLKSIENNMFSLQQTVASDMAAIN
ncbi:unnamed protein product, partial [Didymodactylos carnosus]